MLLFPRDQECDTGIGIFLLEGEISQNGLKAKSSRDSLYLRCQSWQERNSGKARGKGKCEKEYGKQQMSQKGTNQREFIEIKNEGKECKIETGIK